MKKIIIYILVILSIMSCDFYEVDYTMHMIDIGNESSDTLRIFTRHISSLGNITDFTIILDARDTNSRYGDYYRFDAGSSEGYPVPSFTQADFDTVMNRFDSFAVLINENGSWVEKNIPSFWLWENWSVSSKTDDGMGYYIYSFNITDSLLNL